MRFGKTLQQATYQPWKEHYMDYVKLKGMLREHEPEEDSPWTEEDEQKFCDEAFNVQLEKVAKFQQDTFNSLQKRVDALFERLKTLAPSPDSRPGAKKTDLTADRLRAIESDLDSITNDVKELRRYSNINYTGFLKIVKKHDRKRGDRYKIRPMMQLRLASRQFNSEQGYSPLLNKLSVMYFVIRQHVEDTTRGPSEQLPPVPDVISLGQETKLGGERYTSQKFWVHPDNLLEVKTYILRRLPTLVFSQLATAKDLEVSDDPTITSLYFDNSKFRLYSNKVDNDMKATSLRLRWYDQLSAKPLIKFEKKTVGEHGLGDVKRFPIKAKYVKAFIDGGYMMEKTIQKMERQGQSAKEIDEFKETVGAIADFILENQLEPVLRANYVRAAFQKPSDDRVRISLDTNIAFIREDTVDRDRPCRNPEDWHRTDIDDSNMTYPFKNINQSEVSLFPYALLEIKVKEDDSRRRPEWVEDLMASHLVHSAPRFSKFVHGVASLCDDFVNTLPFWLSDMQTDIRKDPQKAFEEEEERRAQKAEGDEVVGSFLGTKVSSYKPARHSPLAKSHISERLAAEMSRSVGLSPTGDSAATPRGTVLRGGASPRPGGYGSTSLFSGLSFSRYKRARQAKRQQPLPEGVEEPTTWIKNAGPLKVEPKVWLANERTYLKWQHICVLLASMAVALHTAAGENSIAMVIGILYLTIAVLTGAWGWYMHRVRRTMIHERSGRDFDNMIGPMGVGMALMASLILNYVFQYRAAFSQLDGNGNDEAGGNSSQAFVNELRF
ncbi:VTC domain-containing protein [Zalerion maritima]|uniref:VTC domain-containing protein n=1 Tax=Zalerion maritima TaxID=339359 RepID=A0AAD5RJK6_9PEZI|nr:VTC domain-containing protein [Zalerion maritima]